MSVGKRMKTLNKIVLLTLAIALSACTPALVNLPNLKLPEQNCPTVAQQACPELKPVACPRLVMPDAIPRNLTIVILEGRVVTIDAGGETLIRQYSATRKAIKAAWHD